MRSGATQSGNVFQCKQCVRIISLNFSWIFYMPIFTQPLFGHKNDEWQRGCIGTVCCDNSTHVAVATRCSAGMSCGCPLVTWERKDEYIYEGVEEGIDDCILTASPHLELVIFSLYFFSDHTIASECEMICLSDSINKCNLLANKAEISEKSY